MLGSRSAFNLGPNSKVDLTYIFKAFQDEGLREFTAEMMTQFIQSSEVIAFMSKIKG